MRSPRALLLHEAEHNWELLRGVLAGEGCEVEEAMLRTRPLVPIRDYYCLALVDIQRLTGRLLETIRSWHIGDSSTTLIVIGNRTAQANRIAVLETGVSAYLTRPVVLPELRARIRAALRRGRSEDTRLRSISYGIGVIDLEARIIEAAHKRVRLTATECGILQYLASHVNQPVASNDLVRLLWGPDPQKGVHSLRLFIRKLRQKLEPDPKNPRYLVTQPTRGYSLQIPVEVLNRSPRS